MERVASAQVLQALAAIAIGSPEDAIRLATRAMQTHQLYSSAGSVAECERIIGQAYGALGKYHNALIHLREAVRIHTGDHATDSRTVDECLYLSDVVLGDGDGLQGVRWIAACEAWFARAGKQPYGALRENYQRKLATIRQRVGEERWQAAWDAGAQLAIEQAVAEMFGEVDVSL